MKASFAGFPQEGTVFLRALRKNNRREWFQPRKQIYEEQVKAPMIELVSALNLEMMAFARDYVSDPKKAIFRIYRDTRFSADKSPYKTHSAAVFAKRGGDRIAGAGFYFGVSPTEIEVAGGAYGPGPQQLLAIRNHLMEHYRAFDRIVRSPGLRKLMGDLRGEQLTRVPRGIPRAHPAADHLRHKQWYFDATLDPSLATTPRLLAELLKRFRAMTPMVEFLNDPLARIKPAPKRFCSRMSP